MRTGGITFRRTNGWWWILLLSWLACGAAPLAAEAPAEMVTRKARVVSLKVVQQLAHTHPQVPQDLLQLYGIKKLLGVVADPPQQDVLLVGLADEPGPPLFLEDLVISLRNAAYRYATRRGNTIIYAPPGCSIDPSPQVIRELQGLPQATSEAGMRQRLQRWEAVCRRPQQVRVFGVPFHSRFAQVLVEADYYLKRLSNGAEDLAISGFTSHTDLVLDHLKRELAQGRPVRLPFMMNRFWFAAGEVKFKEDQDVRLVETCQVILLTEREFLNRRGNLQQSGEREAWADEFARGFTAHYAEIAAIRPIYQDLAQLYRTMAVARLLLEERFAETACLSLDYLLDRFPVPETRVPVTLPGISHVKEHRQAFIGGRRQGEYFLYLPSCGGVEINIRITPETISRDTTGILADLRDRVRQARPSPAALYWDAFIPLAPAVAWRPGDRKEAES